MTLMTNQTFAQLAGVEYNVQELKRGPIVYGITHRVIPQFNVLKDMGECVLITSFSDASVTREDADKLPSNVKRWFSTNVMTDSPRVEAIPIGFVYNYERTQIILRMLDGFRQNVNLMYVNFERNIPRQINPREGLYEKFGKKPWVTCKGGAAAIHASPEEFYEDLLAHKYVLSPPGCGPDCHRHWESMAFGAIPIVLRSKATELLEDMPCLLVDNFMEVGEDLLNAKYEELKQRFGGQSLIKLEMDYWAERIMRWV